MLRAHAIGTCLAIGAGVCAVALLLAGDTVSLPQFLISRTANIDIVLLVSAAYAPLAARCFGGEALALEAGAKRSLAAPDIVLLATLLAPVGVVAGVGLATGDSGFALDVSRDIAVFTAAALLCLTLAGATTAATVPVVYMLVIAVAGLNGDGSSPWWATLRQPATGLETGLALCLLAAALLVFHHWARHRPHVSVTATP